MQCDILMYGTRSKDCKIMYLPARRMVQYIGHTYIPPRSTDQPMGQLCLLPARCMEHTKFVCVSSKRASIFISQN